MEARHTDVDDKLSGPSQVRRRELRLLGHRQIRGPRGKYHDQSASGGWWIRRPGQQASLLIMKGAWQLQEDRSRMLFAGSSEQCHVRLITNRGSDHGNLLGRLSCAINRLRIAASRGPIVIEVCERIEGWLSAWGFSHDQK